MILFTIVTLRKTPNAQRRTVTLMAEIAISQLTESTGGRMRTLPEIIADLDSVLKACIKEKCGISDIIITLATLIAELKDYAESHEDDLK